MNDVEVYLLMATLRSAYKTHCTVVWIAEAKSPAQIGFAYFLGPKLIKAFVKTLDVNQIDINAWAAACLSAFELWEAANLRAVLQPF